MDLEAQSGSVERALAELQGAVAGKGDGKDSKSRSPGGGAEKQRQITQCERLAQRAKTALESYKLELRALPREQQAEHQHRIRGFEEAIRQAKAQIDWKRLDAESAAASSTGPSGGVGVGGAEVDGSVTLDQAVAAADHIQDKSQASVKRSLGMVLQAEQVGIATLQKMHEQDEQMSRIGEEVEDIKANIQRSRKLVGQIARGAARDRCIQMLCALIGIAIMIMVTLAITGKDDGELYVPEGVRQVGQK